MESINLPLKIEQLGVVTSTQDLMRVRLEAGEYVHGLVLQAEAQTGGRGQRARDWQSGVGGSYQTLAVHLPDTELSPRASLAVAVGLAQTLPRYGVSVGVKWPNDLLYRRKKLAGVLLERARQHLLIGVGMNVNNEVPPGAVGLRGWDVAGAHMVVLEGIQVGLALLTSPSASLVEAYAPYDLLKGQRVEIMERRETVIGTARGVSEAGDLLVESGEGPRACRGQLMRFSLGVI